MENQAQVNAELGYAEVEGADTDTRTLVRQVANQMAQGNEIPTAEKVRKQIKAITLGKRNPSALTVQSEMKAWYQDTFWPRHHALGSLPGDNKVPQKMQDIYVECFQRLVVGAVEAAASSWNSDRTEFERQLADAIGAAAEMKASLDEKAAEANGLRDQVEAAVHAGELLKAESAEKDKLTDVLRHELLIANKALQEAAQRQAEHERALNQVRDEERVRADARIRQAEDNTKKVQLELDVERQAGKRLSTALDHQQTQLRTIGEAAIRSEAALAIARSETEAMREQMELLRATVTRLQLPAVEAAKPSPTRTRIVRTRLRKHSPAR